MKRIAIAALLVMTAMNTMAGPIRGLVDVATGLEIPDADARYALAGATGLTTNDSPVMAGGSVWEFALATVTNNASTGTDIVNWQTMTNKIESYNYADKDLANTFAEKQTISKDLLAAFIGLDVVNSSTNGGSADISIRSLGTQAAIRSFPTNYGIGTYTGWVLMGNELGTLNSGLALYSGTGPVDIWSDAAGTSLARFDELQGYIREGGGEFVMGWSDGSRQLYGGTGLIALNIPSSGGGELRTNAVNGIWTSEGTATNGLEIVNWQTMTNQGYLTAPPVTNTTTLEMTNAVSFPNGLYIGGTFIEGTTNGLSYVDIGDFDTGVSNYLDTAGLAFLANDQTFTGENIFSNVVTLSGATNTVSYGSELWFGDFAYIAPTTIGPGVIDQFALWFGDSTSFPFISADSDGGRTIFSGDHTGNGGIIMDTHTLWAGTSNLVWSSAGTPTAPAHIVNKGYLEGWIALQGFLTAPPVTNTTTLEMTNAVSFPNGIYIAGQLIDGTVSTVSVANVTLDVNWLPTGSGTVSIASEALPLAALYVEDATSGKQAVSWQTMAQYADTVRTSQEDITFSASTSEDWAHTNLVLDSFNIVRGRIWVSDTNNNPVDVTTTMTWYMDSDRRGEDAVYRADIGLIQVLVNGAATAGTNTVTVDDASSFAVNDLVVIFDADSTEFVRIDSINVNDVTFENNIVDNVDDNAGFSRVGEYGGFALYGTNQTVWGRATFSSNQTVNLSNWLEYKK